MACEILMGLILVGKDLQQQCPSDLFSGTGASWERTSIEAFLDS